MTDAQSLIRAVDELDQLNQIARYRNHLDDIRDWRAQLTDVMLTISSYSMDLTGVRGTTDRIPGGDALAMLAPWASDAEHGDDLPHPDQIIREWVQTLNGTPRRTWGENWRWLRDETPRILATPWADQWRADIDALWHRLERLTGNAERPTQTQRSIDDCQNLAGLVPDTARITLDEADAFWPGIRNRIDVHRHHERARAKKHHRTPTYRCNPDTKGRYLVADLREHHGATKADEGFSCEVTTV